MRVPSVVGHLHLGSNSTVKKGSARGFFFVVEADRDLFVCFAVGCVYRSDVVRP